MKRLVIVILLGLLLVVIPSSTLATEYHTPGENGTIYAHVLYANGTPANGATLNLTLWRPNGTKELDSVGMSYIAGSNGIYQYNFTTPNVVGVYAVDIVSANPAGYGTDEVHVLALNVTCTNVTCNISGAAIWNTTATGYTDESTFGGLINNFLGGGNMALLGVVGLLALLMVVGFWRKSQAIMWVTGLAWIGFAFWQRSLTPAWGTWDLHEILFYIGFLMAIVCIVEAVMIYRWEQPEPAKRVVKSTTSESAERHQQLMEDIRARARGFKTPKGK